MKRRLAATVVALCFIAAPLSATGAAGNRHCADVTVRVRTLHIEEKWSAKSYKVGDTIVLKVRVTRPSDKDPVTDDGQPLPVERPLAEPAEGVYLGVGAFVGDVYLDGGGLTGADGRDTVKIPVESYTKPGAADTRIYAYKRYLDDIPARCVILEEFGMSERSGTFKITR